MYLQRLARLRRSLAAKRPIQARSLPRDSVDGLHLVLG